MSLTFELNLNSVQMNQLATVGSPRSRIKV